MTLTRKELIKLRKNFLKQFDSYIRNDIEDESIVCDVWFAEGLPDGWDDKDLLDIASDEDLWLDVIRCFNKCCSLAGII